MCGGLPLVPRPSLPFPHPSIPSHPISLLLVLPWGRDSLGAHHQYLPARCPPCHTHTTHTLSFFLHPLRRILPYPLTRGVIRFFWSIRFLPLALSPLVFFFSFDFSTFPLLHHSIDPGTGLILQQTTFAKKAKERKKDKRANKGRQKKRITAKHYALYA